MEKFKRDQYEIVDLVFDEAHHQFEVRKCECNKLISACCIEHEKFCCSECILLHNICESFEFEECRLIPIYLRNAVMVHSSLLAFLNGCTNSNGLRVALAKSANITYLRYNKIKKRCLIKAKENELLINKELSSIEEEEIISLRYKRPKLEYWKQEEIYKILNSTLCYNLIELNNKTLKLIFNSHVDNIHKRLRSAILFLSSKRLENIEENKVANEEIKNISDDEEEAKPEEKVDSLLSCEHFVEELIQIFINIVGSDNLSSIKFEEFMIETGKELTQIMDGCVKIKTLSFENCVFTGYEPIQMSKFEDSITQNISFKGSKHWFKTEKEFLKLFKIDHFPKSVKNMEIEGKKYNLDGI